MNGEIEKKIFGDRIVSNPEILVGKPTIKGTRLSVEAVLGYLYATMDFNELKDAYPRLTDEDIRACLGYAHSLVASELNQLKRHHTLEGVPYFSDD